MIRKLTPMGLSPTSPAINGRGRRKCPSWIEAFIAYTDNLGVSPLFRKWTAITILGATLEQRVWLTTSDQLYPNLYTILVGHPGAGKTRTIMSGRKFLAELHEFHIAPTSMKMASLVDVLAAAKRTITQSPVPVVYNSMILLVDEWTAFMHAYDDELVGGLTTFYDVVVPYEHHRIWRKGANIKIDRPQLSILAGSTPSNLVKFMPDFAWDQGFTSRIILVYSGDRFVNDDFAVVRRHPPKEMIHDLKVINSLQGEFEVTKEYQELVAEWRAGDEKPKPTYPKLAHYNTRRRTHIYKLSMLAAIDGSDILRLDGNHFRTALAWLREVEHSMPNVFKEGTASVDSRTIDEIVDFVRSQGKPVPHHQLVHETAKRVPAYSVLRILEVMWESGRLRKSEDGKEYLAND